MFLSSLVCLLRAIFLGSSIIQISSEAQKCSNCGSPLILTPYIKENLHSKARELSKVASFLPKEWQLVSHSGYVTVNENHDSNLFFWLFPSLTFHKNAPLVLWLGGTPGTASSLSVFFKNGPYVVQNHCECEPLVLHATPYHWPEIMHVLYIDSPVGTGFSFTKNDSGLSETADDVINDLHSAIVQIFQLFPEYQDTEFYIVGESLSAKYATHLAHFISETKSEVQINLKGLAVGNGWLNPAIMVGYSHVFFDVGLIDSKTRDEFKEFENEIVNLIRNEKYSQAFDLLQTYIPFENHGPSLLEDVTGFKYFGNYLQNDNKERISYESKVTRFLNQTEIRNKLHVGSQIFMDFNEDVFDKLKTDLLRPIGPEFGAILDKYRVFLYYGQLELSCGYHLTSKILEKTKWEGSKSFEEAPRRKWYVEGELAGYVKTAGNFSEIFVRDAGLHVADDQPLWSWDLIKKFTQHVPLA